MKAGNKKTLLLVEDNVLVALAKQTELEEYSYNVITVNTGMILHYWVQNPEETEIKYPKLNSMPHLPFLYLLLPLKKQNLS